MSGDLTHLLPALAEEFAGALNGNLGGAFTVIGRIVPSEKLRVQYVATFELTAKLTIDTDPVLLAEATNAAEVYLSNTVKRLRDFEDTLKRASLDAANAWADSFP